LAGQELKMPLGKGDEPPPQNTRFTTGRVVITGGINSNGSHEDFSQSRALACRGLSVLD
jgi:hypothetical protein